MFDPNTRLDTYSWPYVPKFTTDDAIDPAVAADIVGMPWRLWTPQGPWSFNCDAKNGYIKRIF